MPDVLNTVTVTLDDLGQELAKCLDAVNAKDFKTLSFEKNHRDKNTLVKLRLKPHDLKVLREFPGSSKLDELRKIFKFKKIHIEDGIRQESPWIHFGRQLNVYYHWTPSFEQIIFWDQEYYDQKFSGTPFY
ncbi:MAG: hypothetical protein NTX25_22410 [Proteobacteria bacterium]|nr:hypothetical protein [Pseudomonadota bacterium]